MRTTELKHVTIGVVIVVLLAVALLSVIRVRTAHDGDSQDGRAHQHGTVLVMKKGTVT